jgi:A/G-specific adenine glycosylase
MSKTETDEFKSSVISWYNTNGRSFPWRTTTNPFHILLAEMFLRRTTASAVSKVYPSFIKRYETPESLSRSRTSTLEHLLVSLGLQSTRAQHIRETAKVLMKRHKGNVPSDYDTLCKLPGVGRYVANAVLNFAFNQPHPLVDGNVTHLLNRVFLMDFKDATDESAWTFVDQIGSPKHEKELYLGMIDLVAKICLRRKPRCEECPLEEICGYRKTLSRETPN